MASWAWGRAKRASKFGASGGAATTSGSLVAVGMKVSRNIELSFWGDNSIFFLGSDAEVGVIGRVGRGPVHARAGLGLLELHADVTGEAAPLVGSQGRQQD